MHPMRQGVGCGDDLMPVYPTMWKADCPFCNWDHVDTSQGDVSRKLGFHVEDKHEDKFDEWVAANKRKLRDGVLV
jgi:hypothetical protein